MAHHAIAKGHDAAGIRRDHAAQSGRAARGQVNARLELHRRRSLLQSLQGATCTHHGHTLSRINGLYLMHAQQREHDLPRLRYAATHQAGAPSLRHQRHAILCAQAHHRRHFLRRARRYDDACAQVLRVPTYVQQRDGLGGSHMVSTNSLAQRLKQSIRNRGIRHGVFPGKNLMHSAPRYPTQSNGGMAPDLEVKAKARARKTGGSDHCMLLLRYRVQHCQCG